MSPLSVKEYRDSPCDEAERTKRIFDSALDHTPEGMIIVDENGMIVKMSKYYAEALGRSRPEFEGTHAQTIVDTRRLLHPDQTPVESYLELPVHRALKGADVLQEVRFVLLPNDRTITIQMNASPIKDDNGHIIGAVESWEDISQRREAEKALENQVKKTTVVLNSIVEAYFVVDRNWRFVDVNKVAEERVFVRSKKELLGRSIWELYPSGVGTVLYNNYQKAMETGQSVHFEGKSGILPHWFEVHAYPLEDQLIVYLHDIDERKAFEEDLKRRTQELEDANRELEMFGSHVSHDLAAPIRSIYSFAEIVLADYADGLDDEGKDLLWRIARAAHRADHLIEDMLRLAQIGRMQPNCTTFDLSAVVTRVTDRLQQAEPERQCKFEIRQGIEVFADQRLLEIALTNLIQNAWKYSNRQKNAQVEFGVDSSEGVPVYYVKDNGAGFDMSYAEKLFEPFQRLHTTEEFGGSGIGLSMVKKIIGMHGGRIWAESRIDDGATFFFTLHEKRVC